MLTPTLAGKKVLVTGAGGFLGRHLLPVLNGADASVTALVRSRARSLPPEVIPFEGDCSDPAAMQKAVKGQDLVIHMAGLLFGAAYQDYLSANTTYARNIAKAVQNEGSVKKVVFVSSLAASGPSDTAPGRSEADAPSPVSAYGWSKLMAEQVFAGVRDREVATVRPPIIYGSGDRGLLPLFKSCRAGFGLSPGLRKFPVSVIHASDAAKAILYTACATGSSIYHLSDGSIYTMDDICQAMAEAQGRKRAIVLHPPLPIMAVTASLASAGFGLAGAIGLKAGRPPSWNRDKYREARQKGWLADSSLIGRELGFKPAFDLKRGMAEAVAGYRREGWL